MCAYPTKYFQTHYPKHTYFLIWPEPDMAEKLKHQNRQSSACCSKAMKCSAVPQFIWLIHCFMFEPLISLDQSHLLIYVFHYFQGIQPPVLVFVQSKERAKELFHELIYDGMNVDVIHAERTQLQVNVWQSKERA